ncbi:MAG: hypoxanthine phosphoribosyltransferase [Bacteroidales bacterium]
MDQVRVHDRIFTKFISEEDLARRIKVMADNLNSSLAGKDILFLGILNGSFMFIADLYRQVRLESTISFLKLSSYLGTQSTGHIKELIGLNEKITGKTVVVVEDIIDTGRTLNDIVADLEEKGAESIVVVTLLYKPQAYEGNHGIDFIGFEIPNDFVIGYGLDYDGFGRNLPAIYKLSEE